MSAGLSMSDREARPLFVVGTARSGSTLLTKLLDAHPLINLASDPFLPLFRCLRDALLRDSPGFTAGEPLQDFYHRPHGRAQLQTLLEADLSLPFDETAWRELAVWAGERLALENPELVEGLGGLGGSDFRQAFASALALVAKRGNGEETWVGFKEVWVIDFLPALARTFDRARFVVINRDPRGMLASLLQLARRDPGQMAHAVSYLRHWRKQVACLRRFRDMPLLADRMLVLRYEDLVADPQRQALALCGFLELELDQAMLDPPRYRGRGEGAWLGNAASGQALSRIEAGRARSWGKFLEPDLRRLAELICWPDMGLCGYQSAEEDPRRLAEEPGVWRAFLAQDRGRFSWRSDLGDPALDYGAEVARGMMLEPGEEPASGPMVERAFLFPQVYDDLRALAAGWAARTADTGAALHRGG